MPEHPKAGFDVFLSHNSKDKPSAHRLKDGELADAEEAAKGW